MMKINMIMVKMRMKLIWCNFFHEAKKTCRVQSFESDEKEDQDPQSVKYNCIQKYNTTLTDLRVYQNSRGNHNQLCFNCNILSFFIKNSSQDQNIKKNLAFEGRSHRTVVDGYYYRILQKIMKKYGK